MVSLFYDLLTFFGISADAPQNLSEFFPWFLAILVAVALFLFVFGIIKDFTHTFARGGSLLMNGYMVLLLVAVLITLGVSRIARQIVFHPFQTGFNAIKDLYYYQLHRGWHNCPVGALDIYCGYFGSGKTLSLVHKVVGLYNRYNDKVVWCPRRKKFVVQKINILSNVDLAVPYTKLESLAQVVKASKTTQAIDDEEETLTVTIVAMDELSVQMNSRSFKDNFNAYFLNTLLCCRHYHISFYGSAQRFQHVDKLLRDVTHTVIQCNKVWRFQLWASYDAWEMENATNAEMIRPLRRGLWFVRDRDYNAYDTLAVVDNLQKKFEEGDILPEAEIISNQAPAGPLGLEVASKPTKKAQRRMSGQIKR